MPPKNKQKQKQGGEAPSAAPVAAPGPSATNTPAKKPNRPASKGKQPAAQSTGAPETSQAVAIPRTITSPMPEIFDGKPFVLARKPSQPGTLGQRVTIITNCFRISFPKFQANQHKLSIFSMPIRDPAAPLDPKRKPPEFKQLTVRRELKQVFERFRALVAPLGRANVAFDGKDLLWSFQGPLGGPQGQQEVVRDFALDEGDEVKRWKIIIRDCPEAVPVVHSGGSMSPEATQVINTALNYACGLDKVSKGSNIFNPNNAVTTIEKVRRNQPIREPIGPNLAFLGGCFKSARQGESGPQLMVDWQATLIEQGGPLEQVFATITSRGTRTRIDQPIDERSLKTILGELKGLSVRQTVGIVGRKLKIQQFGGSPFHETFMLDGRRTSVAQYFQQTYGCRLRNQHMPCLKTQSGAMIPSEVCHLIANQIYDKKLNETVQANMTQMCIIKPNLRMNRTLQMTNELSRVAGERIQIDGQPVRIQVTPIETEGRVLPPPEIDNLNRQSFMFDIKQFHQMNPMENWSAIQITVGNADAAPRGFDPGLYKALDQLAKYARSTMNWRSFDALDQRNCYFVNFTFRDSSTQFVQKIDQIIDTCKKNASSFTFWVLPAGFNEIYKSIKFCCNQKNMNSQCLNLKVNDYPDQYKRKLERLVNWTFQKNLLLKMNVKNGGTNAPIKPLCMPNLLKGDVMVVGMDVYHPGIGEKEKPSIAGFVASHDKDYLRYSPIVKIQPRTGYEEVIDQVKPAMIQFLQIYKQKNRKFPRGILFYRDGVSEGQLEKVMHLEVSQILDAYKVLQIPKDSIKLTHITVQKRHKFRMYTVQRSANAIEYAKPKPGTVVDKDVVDPLRFEYYLNSHDAALGTAKPSHQTVIVNENDCGYDELEQASYYLSWLSARCCKPISVPVPANYAHLVAERANALFEAARNHPNHSRRIANILKDMKDKRNQPGGARCLMPDADRQFLDGIIQMNLDSQMAFA